MPAPTAPARPAAPQPKSFPDLTALARHLRDELETKKFVLLYAYNGTGKTRLSTEFKNLGKNGDERDTLYFNAFTEDLFQWDNDLERDRRPFLRLNEKSRFFRGLATMEMDNRIRQLLDRYADFDFRIDSATDKDSHLTKAEVVFYPKGEKPEYDTGDEETIKISRGEESIFIWCFFLVVLQFVLDGAEEYKWVKRVYIDDPISSLDEHNAIVVGNHLVQMYREAKRQIDTVVSTHHALFFNVLYYEVKSHLIGPPRSYRLSRYVLNRDRETCEYILRAQKGDTPQFYHVSALSELCEMAREGTASTYHFNILRSILEKTAFFLGYEHFSSCIKKDSNDAEGLLHQRFVDILSHGKYSLYEPIDMGEQTREYFLTILKDFVGRHPFNPDLVKDLPEPKP